VKTPDSFSIGKIVSPSGFLHIGSHLGLQLRRAGLLDEFPIKRRGYLNR
jgi:hypothetical protein